MLAPRFHRTPQRCAKGALSSGLGKEGERLSSWPRDATSQLCLGVGESEEEKVCCRVRRA